MKRTKAITLFLSLLFFVSASLPLYLARPAVAQAPQPIKVGVFIPQTAGLVTYAPWTKQGFELGMIYATTMMGYSNVNKTQAGRPYELHYYDTKGNPTYAATQATTAIETDGIDIMVGATSSAVAAALQPIAESYHKLFFITPAAASSLTETTFTPYAFRLARNSWMDAYTGVKYAMDTLGYTKFAFLAADYSFGYSGVASMTSVIGAKGGSVIATVYAPLGATDFSSYINTLKAANAVNDIQYLFIIWAGNFAYLYSDLATYNLAADMMIGGSCIDILSMNLIQASLTPPATYINTTGLCVYGYKLANNTVNDWMVAQHVARNLYPDLPYYSFRAPELFTPDGFSTAQFLVNVTNAVPDLDINKMINHLEGGLTISAPKGPIYLRPQDHQGLQEMYIAKAVNDTNPASETYGRIIAQRVQTLNRTQCAPPIASVWKGAPYVPGGFAPTTTTTSTTTTTTTTSPPAGFDALTVGAMAVVGVVGGFLIAAVVFRKK